MLTLKMLESVFNSVHHNKEKCVLLFYVSKRTEIRESEGFWCS